MIKTKRKLPLNTKMLEYVPLENENKRRESTTNLRMKTQNMKIFANQMKICLCNFATLGLQLCNFFLGIESNNIYSLLSSSKALFEPTLPNSENKAKSSGLTGVSVPF